MPAWYISRRSRACGCRQRYASDTSPSLLHTCTALLVSKSDATCIPLPAFMRKSRASAYRLNAQSLIVTGNRPGADALQAWEAPLCSGQQLHQVLNLIASRLRVRKALQKPRCADRFLAWAARAASREQQTCEVSSALTMC